MADKAKKPTEEQKVKAAEAVEVSAKVVQTETEKKPATDKASDSPTEPLAKSGKRSAKAIKEAEEKEAKEERRKSSEASAKEEKPKVKPTRSRLERRGKNFRKAAEQIEKGKVYGLTQALTLAAKTSPVKFDATVELHVNLNVDPRHADQNIRDNVVLPAGTGKTVRVAVFADDKVDGADLSGTETITGMLEKGQLDFGVLIATPANMPKLGKYARLLGPRGLMPNPKSGTVTNDLAKAVSEAKAGRVEYRVDSTGIVHLGIGKVSFGPAKLEENARAVLANIKSNKPASVKSAFVKAVHIATTMGPSVAVDSNSI